MTVARRFVLASASVGRLGVLRMAGFDPEVVVSGIDEDIVAPDLPGAKRVVVLAEAKLAAVVEDAPERLTEAVVLACDSMFEFEGSFVGKPPNVDVARERIHSMRGNSGELHSGHAVIDMVTGRRASAGATTVVRFGHPSDEEVEAYLATGESLRVAGGFTLDGRSAPFLDGIVGDHGNVIGVSLPLVRELLAQIDVGITELWT